MDTYYNLQGPLDGKRTLGISDLGNKKTPLSHFTSKGIEWQLAHLLCNSEINDKLRTSSYMSGLLTQTHFRSIIKVIVIAYNLDSTSKGRGRGGLEKAPRVLTGVARWMLVPFTEIRNAAGRVGQGKMNSVLDQSLCIIHVEVSKIQLDKQV